MVRVDISTEVKRPVAEVFAYVSDPANLPEWNSLVQEASASETPIRVGTKIMSRVKFLGRRIEQTAEVTEFAHDKKFVFKGDKPFPATITNLFEAATGGTKLTQIGEFEPGGFFKVGEPILARITKKQFEAQLDTLKELLEARAPAAVR